MAQFGYFNLGGKTHTVPMKLHKETREKLFSGLGKVDGAAVVLEGGQTSYRHDTDHEHLFRQESYFHYLTGVREPDCFVALDLEHHTSILFVPRLDPSYAIWLGKIHPTEHFVKVYEVDECYFTDEIDTVLKQKGINQVLVLNGQNTDSGSFHHGATFKGIENFTVDKEKLFPVLQECRVIKTEEELKVLRYVCKVTADAHKEVMRSVRPGQAEYEMEAVFTHYTYRHGGCRHNGYTCICASGENSAVLHYGHAGAPNEKIIKDGDILMFDMGGEYHCYGADVSRSFPSNGKFTESQKEIYLTVLAAQNAVLNTMKEGVSWPAMHRLADRVILENLKKYDYVRGDVDEMMKEFIGSLFMPHGLGHFLGLDTHDVGGYPNGMERTKEPGLKSLRCGRVLKENMVITVEPGVYFIQSLLEPAFQNPSQSKFLNEEKIRSMFGFGGVRIEDDVVVKKDGAENMTESCPRSIEEIEALMAPSK
eukprot:TRINITY_DN11337_c0_g1_i1.p1 TRINITY_DN11337_c0_g1~~TRINITY_DN11337_c0_g1_i1.p1  ORF type:complete len:479 (-),score=113.60 TRINITY_DN11337_c0_g1_i1:125-1561(-)